MYTIVAYTDMYRHIHDTNILRNDTYAPGHTTAKNIITDRCTYTIDTHREISRHTHIYRCTYTNTGTDTHT